MKARKEKSNTNKVKILDELKKRFSPTPYSNYVGVFYGERRYTL